GGREAHPQISKTSALGVDDHDLLSECVDTYEVHCGRPDTSGHTTVSVPSELQMCIAGDRLRARSPSTVESPKLEPVHWCATEFRLYFDRRRLLSPPTTPAATRMASPTPRPSIHWYV